MVGVGGPTRQVGNQLPEVDLESDAADRPHRTDAHAIELDQGVLLGEVERHVLEEEREGGAAAHAALPQEILAEYARGPGDADGGEEIAGVGVLHVVAGGADTACAGIDRDVGSQGGRRRRLLEPRQVCPGASAVAGPGIDDLDLDGAIPGCGPRGGVARSPASAAMNTSSSLRSNSNSAGPATTTSPLASRASN